MLTTDVVRFLALAATLLSEGSGYKATRTMHYLLDRTSAQKQLLPTVQQLKDLFLVLEKKIGCSGFVDSLYGWNALLSAPELGLGRALNPQTLDDLIRAQTADPTERKQNIDHGSSRTVERDLKADSRSGKALEVDTEPSFSRHQMTYQSQRTEANASNTAIRSNEDDSSDSDFDGHLPSLFSTLGLDNLFSGSWNSHLRSEVRQSRLGQQERPDTSVFSSQQCPGSSDIHDVLRALSELGRLGEVTSVLIQLSPSVAVWVIAFIKWCMGIEPSVYLSQDESDVVVLHQPKSKVRVLIDPSSSWVFKVKTFKGIKHLQSLLWESPASALVKPRKWSGMVRPKEYFCLKLRKIEARWHLYNLFEILLFLSRDLVDCLQLSDNMKSRIQVFPSSSEIIHMISTIFNREKFDLSNIRGEEMRAMLRDSSAIRGAAQEIADLFYGLLLLSLIENMHWEKDPDIFIDSAFDLHCDQNFCEDIKNYFHLHQVGRPVLNASLRDLRYSTLGMLGSDQSIKVLFAGEESRLISSAKGQVAYLSFLETLSTKARQVVGLRVFAGRLTYENEQAQYAIAEDNNHLPPPQYTPEDFSMRPLSDPKPTQSDGMWLCSHIEDHLSIYYVPSTDLNYSINPTLFLQAAGRLHYLERCSPQCPPLSDFSSSLLYCANIHAAMSEQKPHLFRVVTCAEQPSGGLLAQATINQTISRGLDDEMIVVVVVVEHGCLACACAMDNRIREGRWTGEPPSRIIVIK